MISFRDFPSQEQLLEFLHKRKVNALIQVNNHFHSPYSFSAFNNLKEVFEMAVREEINVLGLNDFYVADGYPEFWKLACEYKRFPLFNIEFIGLLQQEKENKIRVNDPNNPGRIYFSGKGLDFPFHLSFWKKLQVQNLRKESQLQVKEMILKVNKILYAIDSTLQLDYVQIKGKLAKELVRERHIAKAIRMMLDEKIPGKEEKMNILKSLYGGIESKVAEDNHAALENEIRANLLKSGGRAFVEEDPKSFLDLEKIIAIIKNAGGIPCYPVLLDDKNGTYTEFEENKEKLCARLKELNIHCIELIPGRNDKQILESFVRYFHSQNFIISFGTEHNSPEMIPLKITARGQVELSEEINRIAIDGACILAAHQYLRAKGHQGYIYKCGTWALDRRPEFVELGMAVIQFFNQNK
jgi:hypothetical protein